MDKVKIKLVRIGHQPLHLNLKKIAGWKSALFQLEGEIEDFALRCDSDGDSWEFSDALLKNQLPKKFEGHFLIAIVNVPLEDNWYSRRLGTNQIVFTFHQIKDFLKAENIPLENAILRILYAYALLYKRAGNKIPEINEAIDFTHDETRGCLFDMNGIKSDLVESCNKPVVCPECEERLRKDSISMQTIKAVQREIKSIRKPRYFRALDFIKTNPITALLISSIFAIALGVIGSLIASFTYDKIKLSEVESVIPPSTLHKAQ